jgi:hypothetical protein
MGDSGADSISANDGLSDTIDCGDNLHDVVTYDAALDEISNCEFQNPLAPRRRRRPKACFRGAAGSRGSQQ